MINLLLSQDFFQYIINEYLKKCLIRVILAFLGLSNIGINIYNNELIYTSDNMLSQKNLCQLDNLIKLLGIELDISYIYEIIDEAYLTNEHMYRKNQKIK